MLPKDAVKLPTSATPVPMEVLSAMLLTFNTTAALCGSVVVKHQGRPEFSDRYGRRAVLFWSLPAREMESSRLVS